MTTYFIIIDFILEFFSQVQDVYEVFTPTDIKETMDDKDNGIQTENMQVVLFASHVNICFMIWP